MANNYWIRNRGKTQGPYSLERLKQLVERGQLNPTVQISEDGVTWERPNAYPELFSGMLQGSQGSDPTENAASQESGYSLGETASNDLYGNDSAKTWRYAENGRTSQPVAFQEIQRLVSFGMISPDGLVWNESMPNWVKAKDVPGLVPRAAQPSAEPASRTPAISVPAAAPLSQFAIVSFVCGMVGVAAAPFFGIPALIFGYIGLYGRPLRSGRLRGKGLAITGIVAGWFCVVALIVLLVFALNYPLYFELYFLEPRPWLFW